MTMTLGMFLKAAGNAGRVVHIEKTRKRIYELSRQLPTEDGYELIEDFDNAIKYTKQLAEEQGKTTATDQESDE